MRCQKQACRGAASGAAGAGGSESDQDSDWGNDAAVTEPEDATAETEAWLPHNAKGETRLLPPPALR